MDDWLVDGSPGAQSVFKTCRNKTLTEEEVVDADGCGTTGPPVFKQYISSHPGETYPLVHSTMLEVYNNSYVSHAGNYYTVYGAVNQLYPSNTKWIISGHSLGAALAELCSADLGARGVKINSVYMLADPSPGNDVYRGIYLSLIHI